MRKYYHLLIVQKEFTVTDQKYINLDFDLGLADHPSQYQLFFVSGATYFMNLAEPTSGKKPSTPLECGL